MKLFSHQKPLFHQSVRGIILLAQIFGLLPVKFFSCRSSNMKFTWRSKRVLFSIFMISSSLFFTITLLLHIFVSGYTLHRLSSLVFNATSVINGIIFLKLAKNWPRLIKKWNMVEICLRKYDNYKPITKNIYLILAIIMTAAIVEHVLSKIHQFLMVADEKYIFEAYFLNDYPHLSKFFGFSVPLVIYATILTICNVFSWNFLDAFLIILSYDLTQKFQQINEKVILAYKTKIKVQHYWMRLREDYNKISVLCKIVNQKISGLILVSFATNMFFITSQFYWTIVRSQFTTGNFYFYFSFFLLVSRTLAVTLFASRINEESKKSLSYLFSIDSNMYNTEIERFTYQINCQSVAWTGNDYFTITKGLLFSMAGTIVTYELFLIQSNAFTNY